MTLSHILLMVEGLAKWTNTQKSWGRWLIFRYSCYKEFRKVGIISSSILILWVGFYTVREFRIESWFVVGRFILTQSYSFSGRVPSRQFLLWVSWDKDRYHRRGFPAVDNSDLFGSKISESFFVFRMSGHFPSVHEFIFLSSFYHQVNLCLLIFDLAYGDLIEKKIINNKEKN